MNRNFLNKIKIKFGKHLARTFPFNPVRVFGLRLCGFKVGKKVYIGSNLTVASLISKKGCELIIEDRVAIGPNVTLVLSSDANNSELNKTIKPIVGKIHLKSDCWLGAGVIILPNITVGEMSVVGAGSVVTRSVENKTIVTGSPAKFLKKVDEQKF